MEQKTIRSKRVVLVFALTFLVWAANAQLCIPPVLSLQPTNSTICVGDASVFAVVAVGLNLSYQWQVDEGSGYHNCSDGSTYSGSLTASLLEFLFVNCPNNKRNGFSDFDLRWGVRNHLCQWRTYLSLEYRCNICQHNCFTFQFCHLHGNRNNPYRMLQ
jgi:hypothetical protein